MGNREPLCLAASAPGRDPINLRGWQRRILLLDMRAMMRAFLTLALSLSLAGCIPPGRGDVPVSAGSGQPRLDTDLAAIGADTPAAWSGQGITPDARRVAGGTYPVAAGDSLLGIARKTGASATLIAEVNGLAPPYVLQPGQILTIPAGRYHRVAAGETGIGIARAYGVSWPEMVALNRLAEPFVLQIGQSLLLPASTPAQPASLSLEQRASAFNLGIDDIVTGSQPAVSQAAASAPPSSSASAPPASSSPPPSAWRQAVDADTPIVPPASFDGRFIWPVKGRILSSFGSKGGGRVNDGLDIAVPRGTPIKAAGDGIVVYAGTEIGVFGGLVLITHGSGWVTAYGHAERLNVVRGQKVRSGEVIALAGDSGYVSEPQLHFEIRKDRKPIDPLTKLGQLASAP